MKDVATYDDVASLERLMVNAKRLGREDVYQAALRRRCEIAGLEGEDDLEREALKMLAAYESVLEQRHGRKQIAGYTRRKLKEKGAKQCLVDWATAQGETAGFQALVAAGLKEWTGEAVIMRHAQDFEPEVVEAARLRMATVEEPAS